METPNEKTSKITTEEEALELLKQVGDVLNHGGSAREKITVALRYIPGR
jgi:hypothetical protein